jgi:hypothetical protein
MSDKDRTAEINEKLRIGLINAYANMLAFKKYKNSPVIIARDGKIVAVPADKMPPARGVNCD